MKPRLRSLLIPSRVDGTRSLLRRAGLNNLTAAVLSLLLAQTCRSLSNGSVSLVRGKATCTA